MSEIRYSLYCTYLWPTQTFSSCFLWFLLFTTIADKAVIRSGTRIGQFTKRNKRYMLAYFSMIEDSVSKVYVNHDCCAAGCTYVQVGNYTCELLSLCICSMCARKVEDHYSNICLLTSCQRLIIVSWKYYFIKKRQD